MTDYDYDLFVIGAGSGGVRASRMAAQFGAKVAVAEEYRVGGTCVIRGCVPKKLFVYASHFSGHFKDAAGYGWNVEPGTFDWSTLVANKDQEIDRLNRIYIQNMEKAGVEIIDCRATVKGPHTIELVQEGREVTAKNILVATGAWPYRDRSVKGIEHAITSNEAFELQELPKQIMVVGGGYIAVEFASIFHGLGVETSLIYRGEQILRGFDDDLRNGLHDAMVAKGINVETNVNLVSLDKVDDGYNVTLTNGEVIHTGLVMTAIGRTPNTRGLGLEEVGVECAANGAICVDEFSQTTVPSIYAVGDVTDRMNLTPVAIKEGAAFAQTVFNETPMSADHDLVPTAVFSQPEIGTVGLTESEAREKFGEVDIYRSTFNPMKNTMTGKQERTMMKIIVEPTSDKILGIHILGPDSGEMIQCLGIAVKMGATKSDFDATMPVHPTAAEELVTMAQMVS